jgi:hypothetical protein
MKLKPVDLALIVLAVVIVIVAAALLLSTGGSTGDEVTTTVRLEFGSPGVPSPINPGNDTVWTKVGNEWAVTSKPNSSGITTWTFRNLTSGSNCYDQLMAAAKIGGFHVVADNQTMGTIVTEIANDANLEHESRAWQYYVNGVYANKACNKFAILNGDVVIWKYITNQAS